MDFPICTAFRLYIFLIVVLQSVGEHNHREQNMNFKSRLIYLLWPRSQWKRISEFRKTHKKYNSRFSFLISPSAFLYFIAILFLKKKRAKGKKVTKFIFHFILLELFKTKTTTQSFIIIISYIILLFGVCWYHFFCLFFFFWNCPTTSHQQRDNNNLIAFLILLLLCCLVFIFLCRFDYRFFFRF